ncbi:MAG: YcxB family protein [Candidatus Berkiellales bacterium]
MLIQIQYDPTAKELVLASSLFVEKKPMLSFMVKLINVFSGFLLLVLLIKLIRMGLLPSEWLAVVAAMVWIWGRKPFNEWLLMQRMKRSPVIGKTLTVEISRNGIVWSGKGLKPGDLDWAYIKYIMEAQNGFILPNQLTQFLWLPFRGFKSPDDIKELREYLNERKIEIRRFPKWRC